ncbi:MAG: glutaredoxin family protein [Endomicrobium sp.]|jgi:glutaredoxin|nr:glutaredoxin family protein [Endomicrobium sp.]
MTVKHVDGTNDKKSVFLYALSTCPWCKKTKTLLDELKVKYDYLYVDLVVGQEQEEILAQIEVYNPGGGFPTLVIDKAEVIIGYKPEAIKEALA